MRPLDKIRLTQPGDEESVKDLLRACGQPDADLLPGHLDHFFVIYHDGYLAGSVGLEPHGSYGLLRSLAVSPAVRSRAIGSGLTQEMETYALSTGIRDLYLLTTTAREFFLKHGYQVIARETAPEAIQATQEFRNICPSTAVCMHKRIENER